MRDHFFRIALHAQKVAWHIGPCERILYPVHIGQYARQLPVQCSVVVRPLTEQLLHTHCHGPPFLRGLVAGG